MTETTLLATLRRQCEALEWLESWLGANPQLQGIVTVATRRGLALVQISESAGPNAFAAAVRSLVAGAELGSVVKDIDQEFPRVTRTLPSGAKVEIWTTRETICEATVVGTETVSIPDPAAPMVEVERDIIEWQCTPLLAGAAAVAS